MTIEIPQTTIEQIQQTCEGYDIPAKLEEIAQTINEILIEWAERLW